MRRLFRMVRPVAAATLAAGLMITGCTSKAAPAPPPSGSSKPLHAPANFDPSFAGAVACSAKILSGTVVTVATGRPGRMITTLDVDQWVKPASGPSRTRIDTVDLAVSARWHTGQHLYLAIDVDPTVLPNTVDRASFAHYRAARAHAATLECPYGPS
jgi:hypothetical protein